MSWFASVPQRSSLHHHQACQNLARQTLERLLDLRDCAIGHVEPGFRTTITEEDSLLRNEPEPWMDLVNWPSDHDTTLYSIDPALAAAPTIEIEMFPAKLEELLRKSQVFERTIIMTHVTDDFADDTCDLIRLVPQATPNEYVESEISDNQSPIFALSLIGEGEEIAEGIRVGASVPARPGSCMPYPNKIIETDILGDSEFYSPMKRTTHYPVIVEDVKRLDEVIRKCNKVASALHRIIKIIRSTGYNEKRRWKHGGLCGDKRRLMKSGGRSTPLFQSIAIDDEWPDDWTLALREESPKMISEEFDDRKTDWASSASGEHPKLRKPKW